MHAIFRGSKVCGQTEIILNVTVGFNTWMKIPCSQWLPEVWSQLTSTNSEFLPSTCFATPLLFVCGSLCFQLLESCSVCLTSGDWLGHYWIFNFFHFRMHSCFHNLFWLIIHHVSHGYHFVINTLMKGSLDYTIWQWYNYLLLCILDLSWCFEGFFFLFSQRILLSFFLPV